MKLKIYDRSTYILAHVILTIGLGMIYVATDDSNLLLSGLGALGVVLSSFVIGVQVAFRVVEKHVAKGRKK